MVRTVTDVTQDDRTLNAAGSAPDGHDHVPQYEVRVKGRLDTRWSAWFDGLSVTAEEDGTTVIRGAVLDQAALHGLLQKLRDVGIPLLSLTELPNDANPTEGNLT